MLAAERGGELRVCLASCSRERVSWVIRQRAELDAHLDLYKITRRLEQSREESEGKEALRVLRASWLVFPLHFDSSRFDMPKAATASSGKSYAGIKKQVKPVNVEAVWRTLCDQLEASHLAKALKTCEKRACLSSYRWSIPLTILLQCSD